MTVLKNFLIGVLSFMAVSSIAQTTNVMNVNVGKLGAPVQPTMYGLFFEDINYAADGGLYAELVKNRSFEFPQRLAGWIAFGNVTVRDDGPFNRNPHYVRLAFPGHEHKRTGIENEGFFGIGIRKGAEYRFSVWARVPEGEVNSSIRIELIDPSTMEERQAFASENLTINSKEWKKYEVILKSDRTEHKAHLRIFLTSKNSLDLEHISLFPVETWKGRENGLRKDIAAVLADIKPGVFRFPGGCIVEGTELATRYNWKNSIGPVENRPLNENRWHYTFDYRFFPEYFQSYGLGFYEYFCLSEDIGAEPLPVLNCGLACQYQNDSDTANVPVDALDPYVKDALDLIEFANGDVSTEWGKVRAEMGHPEPFNLKFIAIGNEQWGPEYTVRLERFVKVIREKYPKINIVGGSGPGSEGDQFEYLWPEMKRLMVDLVDEHFYRSESWFLSEGARYDKYDRKGPKVFAGEYACHGRGKKYNHFNASLLEAALMTGYERNSDVVYMATYAPLLAHVEGWQWRPDLIWFDNLNVVRTCSYYVQSLYANNKGTNVLKLTMENKPVTGADGQNGLFASAVWDANKKMVIVKVVNTSNVSQHINISFSGLKKGESLTSDICTILHAAPDADNSIENPEAVLPKNQSVSMDGNSLTTDLGAQTFAVYRFIKK